MLLIETKLDRSQIHGIGVYTLQQLHQGQRTWSFKNGLDCFITDEEYRLLPQVTQDFISTFAVYKRDISCYLLCGDHARFLNHCDSPNLVTVGDYTLALRDVELGEELTCNYFEFDDHAHLKLKDAVHGAL